jgi:SAM-dependent methyltransferase
MCVAFSRPAAPASYAATNPKPSERGKRMNKRSLLIGCGHSRAKKVHLAGEPEWAGDLVTMDINPDCGADIVFDLSALSIAQRDTLCGAVRLPFDDRTFDEIGAYDVLEHFGRQGDWRGWFTEMAEFHRILKPGGTFGIIVPIGGDALTDPGHTRFFHKTWFYFLNQGFYENALAQGAPVTDYRHYWTLNFDVIFCEQQEDHHIAVMLRKPA